MKLRIFITGFWFVTTVSLAAFGASSLPEKNSLMAKILDATDARDYENAVFEQAIKAGRFEALRYLGQIGGEACQKLIPYLRGENQAAKKWAAEGAMLCHDDKLSALLLAELAKADDKAPWLEALGFSGGEGSKEAIAANLGASVEAGLFALVQSVAYDSAEAADIVGLKILEIMDYARDGGQYGAAYALARLRAVPTVLPYTQFEPAFFEVLNPKESLAGTRLEIMRLLVRLAREYGNDSALILMLVADQGVPSIRQEAIRSMGWLTDAETKPFLLKLADSEAPSAERHLAVDALGRRSAADPDLVDVLVQYVSDDDPWVATTATRWLGQRDAGAANEIAASWLGGDDYYLAFQALIALSASDEGRALLQEYADANPNSVRGYEAAVALDPSLEAATKARKTPSYNTLAAYQGRELLLETTRGKVCISMTGDAPYAATNFLQLADVGKMDGMLWHRVIPNFVAQAGQIEDRDIGKWGSIREEWGGEHRTGTVGVATAGRDTGTVQFFINTGYNMHLNNRYTVFGKVTKGMDHVYKLQEGDVITRASTTRSSGGTCES